jgi:hypothetical protein
VKIPQSVVEGKPGGTGEFFELVRITLLSNPTMSPCDAVKENPLARGRGILSGRDLKKKAPGVLPRADEKVLRFLLRL